MTEKLQNSGAMPASIDSHFDQYGAMNNDDPQMDAITHTLDDISAAAYESSRHTTDVVEVLSPPNPFTAFIEQHNLTHGNVVEVIEGTPHELTEQDVRRQNDVIDILLSSDDKRPLLAFLNEEAVLDTTVLRKVIDTTGEAAFAIFWAEEVEEKRTLYEIANVVGDKLKYVPKGEFAEIAESLVEKGGQSRLITAVREGGVPSEIVADVLMSHKEYSLIAGNIDCFDTIDPRSFVNEAYERGDADIILSNLYNFPEVDKDDLIERIYAGTDYTGLAYFMDAFPNLDKGRLVNKLYEQARPDTIVSCLRQFPDVDKQGLILQCIEQQSTYCIASTPEVFEGVDVAFVKDKLREGKCYEVLLKRRDIFPDVAIDEIVDGLIEDNRGYAIVDAIGRVPEITPETVYQKLLDGAMTDAIVEELHKFPNTDANMLIKRAIDEGAPWTAIRAIDSAPGVDKAAVVNHLIHAGYGVVLKEHREKVSELSDDMIAAMFFENEKYADFIAHREGFPNVDAEYLERCFLDALNNNSAQLSERDFTALNDYLTDMVPTARQPLELRLANRYMSFCGATVEGYNLVKELNAEREVPAEAARIGVTQTGVKGLEQFGVSCSRLSRQLMDVTMADDTLQSLQESGLYRGILQKMYRVDSAEFGDTTESSLKELLDYYVQAKSDGRIAPLDEYYQAATVEVATLKSEKDRVELTEDAYSRYTVLRLDILDAVAALETKQPFTHLTRELGDKINEEIMSTRQQIASPARADQTDKAFEYMSKNLRLKDAALTSLIAAAKEGKYMGRNFALRSPADMSSVFSLLEPFDALHGEMRRMTFAWALRKNPHMIDQLKNLGDEPNVEDLGVVRSFVDQIVNNETFGNYFSDKKTATRFKKLTSVRSLDEALIRHQSHASVDGHQVLQIMPSRSFAMELSGHVADACWASKYESMAEKFPNMTSLILKRGEDGATNERLVGSAMLIETSDEKGQPVLLLRGVNPIENYINKVQVSDFYNAMTSYCKAIAERKGMKPAIVIDDMSGASGTNRPALHEYMEKMKEHMQNVAVDEATTTFNGYDVTQKSYAL